MVKIDYFDAVKRVANGAKVFHVLHPEGVCYVIADDLPAINNAFVVAELPRRFARRPRLYDSHLYFRGWFWWATN